MSDTGAAWLRAASPTPIGVDPWRVLTRIGYARWAVVALAVSYVVVGRPANASPPLLTVGLLVASAVNALVASHRRFPRLDPDEVALATLMTDFLWVTLAALAVGPAGGENTAMVGYVVVSLEGGLLLGWAGALGSSVAAVATLAVLAASTQPSLVVSTTLYQGATVMVASLFGAVASTELRAQRRQLLEQSAALVSRAETDHLTGLGNLLAFRKAVSTRRAPTFGILLVDVDRMRVVNSVYGYIAGDELLMTLARLLRAACADGMTAARLSEDKFAVLVDGADVEICNAVANEIRLATHGAAASSGELRVSIGFAWSIGGEALDMVLARADDALFAAKAMGGDRVVGQGYENGGRRWGWRSAVETVLAADRGVYAVYQPIVRLSDRSVAGWEALSRPSEWPPGASVEGLFLTAHRIGRSRELDWRCRRNALWEAGRLTADVLVNVNVASLTDPVHDVDQMLLVCKWARRDPRSVVLELSERDSVADLTRLRQVLAAYREAGFRFAVDDIGQGQTTLELLLAARPEFVKLAQTLLHAARDDTVVRSATHALVSFAHDVGATVVAEGVENETDLRMCEVMEIDLGQGWFFGRPVPADRVNSPG